ncbi:MAG: penicillin-binding protein 2 [Paracoccaceae bacterium]|nr:penicillin-binding protein 2 [Paracoccaceae bacterium]
MIRTPLRPLATILEARKKGENPDEIERANIRVRHEDMQHEARMRSEGRLLVLGMLFFCGFLSIGARMAFLAASDPQEPVDQAFGRSILAQRADIIDRKGRILATNMETSSLYAHPHQLIDPKNSIRQLMQIFPDLDKDRLIREFSGDRRFVWVKKKVSPEQKQAVYDIGDPGLLLGPREMRLYPNGSLAAHVLGGARFGREDVRAAEVLGAAGVELQFDEHLRDISKKGAPLQLSLDLSVQAAVERVLSGGMKIMNAKGAVAVLMNVHSGEVISLASLPDFDPNHRPIGAGKNPDNPVFNRAVQGIYELGSTFKILAVAQAMELGLVDSDTIIDIRKPIRKNGFWIRDSHNNGKELSVSNVISESSNIGTAKIAQMIGVERQKEFLQSFGLLDKTALEIAEASGGKPMWPRKHWTELSAMTISYGHGLAVSPLHLAAAYATIANGGYKVTPTILRQEDILLGPRVLSQPVAKASVSMLRRVVTDGTAKRYGDVPGYAVAGKTGTSDKAKQNGRGYHTDRVLALFASIFPSYDPQFVLIVMLDEAEETVGDKPRRSAALTAVPVAAKIIGRIAPLLGLRPRFVPKVLTKVELTAN